MKTDLAIRKLPFVSATARAKQKKRLAKHRQLARELKTRLEIIEEAKPRKSA